MRSLIPCVATQAFGLAVRGMDVATYTYEDTLPEENTPVTLEDDEMSLVGVSYDGSMLSHIVVSLILTGLAALSHISSVQ